MLFKSSSVAQRWLSPTPHQPRTNNSTTRPSLSWALSYRLQYTVIVIIIAVIIIIARQRYHPVKRQSGWYSRAGILAPNFNIERRTSKVVGTHINAESASFRSCWFTSRWTAEQHDCTRAESDVTIMLRTYSRSRWTLHSLVIGHASRRKCRAASNVLALSLAISRCSFVWVFCVRPCVCMASMWFLVASGYTQTRTQHTCTPKRIPFELLTTWMHNAATATGSKFKSLVPQSGSRAVSRAFETHCRYIHIMLFSIPHVREYAVRRQHTRSFRKCLLWLQ